MRTPEEQPNWGWEEVDETIADEWSFSLLIEQERIERAEAFASLRNELYRIEAFGGMDVKTSASYHETFLSEGTKMSLFFCRATQKDSGDFHRIWINTISSTDDGGRELHAYDFAVSCTDELLIVNEDTRYRGPRQHGWPDIKEIYAPYMQVKNGTLTRVASPNYRFATPTYDERDKLSTLEIIDQRIYAKQLIILLKQLNEATHETNVTW